MHPFAQFRKRSDPPMTQAALAERLGVSTALVTHIETGRRQIPAEKAIEYERRLGGAVTRYQLRPDIFGPPPSEAAA